MKRVIFCVACIAMSLPASITALALEPISLAGQWHFALDRDDAGVQKEWFKQALPDQIKLPGSLQEQGFGDPPSVNTDWMSSIGAKLLSEPKYAPYTKEGSFKTPFWLTPARHYVGPAWYQREIEIPADWGGKRIVLFLQRPNWETTVWVDDRLIGSQNSLGTPHVYDVTAAMTPGSHRVTIRVDNRMTIPVGKDAHSISDQTESDWNGIIGELKLIPCEKLWIDDVQAYPDGASRKVKLEIEIGNLTNSAGEGVIHVAAATHNTTRTAVGSSQDFPVKWDAKGGNAEINFDLGSDAKLWDEFSPALYDLTLELKSKDLTTDTRRVTIGLRHFGTSGTQFTMNGRPIFLRGTLECCIFPLTGYPPTDVESWKRILTIARAHGLNHLRFHSWCPPEAAFAAADEMGFYYQVECSCWAAFGSGMPVDQWVYDEADRMLKTYGNHPSFILMAPSNEPAGKERDAFLGKWVAHFAQLDPRRKYTAGSGWPQLSENNYHVMSAPRMHQSKELSRAPQTSSDYTDVLAKYTVPVITHEMGQWCAYPNFDEIAKYTGSLEAREALKSSGTFSQKNAGMLSIRRMTF